MMLRMLQRAAVAICALLAPLPAIAAGTLPIMLQQQFSFSACNSISGSCGQPLNGGLLYFFVAGTVATPQDSFQDTALTLKNTWPLQLDANGRVPVFYLADGSIHVRLTDSSGVVQFDTTSLVIGPSSGGPGPGSTVDPTTIMATGDIKFRPTSEFITGWVKINGQTVGSATSGATGRANADTQNLFVYLWTNCIDTHCAVSGGRGATALADFTANKRITLPDWRARMPIGLDDMGNTAAGRLLAANVTSGGDTVTTPGATGGEANHTLLTAEMPTHTHSESAQTFTFSVTTFADGGTGGGRTFMTGITMPTTGGTTTVTTNNSGVNTGNAGSGNAHNVMNPFMLGTWFMKL